MNNLADDGRARELDAVLGLVRTRTTAVRRDVLERFVVRYFGRSIPRTSPSARRPTCTARRCRTGTSRGSASRATPACASFNPTIEEHGWQSTHTIIEIVNDDMPFLVDSVTMEVNRHGLTLHLIIHPIVAVAARQGRRRSTDVAPEGAPDAIRESFIHVEVDRVTEPARARRRSPPTSRACSTTCAWRSNDWKKMKDKLLGVVAEVDAAPAADAAGGARRVQGVPVLARQRALHVPRLPLPRSRRGRRAGRAQDRPGIEPRLPARKSEAGRRDELRGVAAGGSRVRARTRPPDRHQGQRALDGAPAGLSRLRRRQALRRRGQRLRRAPLPRALHVDRVQREPGRHSAPAAQDGQRRRRAPAWRAAATPARRCATSSPPIRATSSSRRARTSCCARRWASCIWASGSASGCSSGAIRSSAFSSCLIYSPRENYTTELREKWQAILHAGVQRHELGLQRASVGVGAGARDDHGAHDAGQDSRIRRPRARGAARAGGAALGATISRTR